MRKYSQKCKPTKYSQFLVSSFYSVLSYFKTELQPSNMNISKEISDTSIWKRLLSSKKTPEKQSNTNGYNHSHNDENVTSSLLKKNHNHTTENK